MNILIIGGRKKADFLLKSLVEKNHDVTLIHDNYEYCKVLARKYDAPVICGDGSLPYILEEGNVQDADVVIAMTNKDATNLVICQLSKKLYGIKKTFATVSNPKNVEIFKRLGVDTVVSATHVVARTIEQIASVNDICDCVPIEDGKVSIMEIIVKENSPMCDKYIKDINFSDDAIIGCIIRGTSSIIAKGNTKVLAKDKLLVISTPYVQQDVIKAVVGGE